MFRNVVAVSVGAVLVALLVFQRNHARKFEAQVLNIERQLAQEKTYTATMVDKVTKLEQERDRLQKDATEVHRLRAEISTLRNSAKALEQQAARATQRAEKAVAAATEAPAQAFVPPTFANYGEMGKFVANLRAKAFGGGALTPQEQQYLQTLKPELEKLERSPAEFAAFQTELIQSAAGISDPAKTEKIRELVQHVYENALTRGLDVTSRPEGDANWVQQRFQLDRRGTSAVQELLTEEERAAFDRRFIGIMGVDLGTGVDKRLYPPGFLSDQNQ